VSVIQEGDEAVCKGVWQEEGTIKLRHEGDPSNENKPNTTK
jgi:hypothetical protein